MAIQKRIFTLLFLVLAVALAGALILFVVYPEISMTKEGIRLALEKMTNKPISVEDVHLGFSPTSLFDLTIEGLVVELPEENSKVSIQSVNLKPSLASLMKLKILISSVTVKGLRASVAPGKGHGALAFPIPLPLGGLNDERLSEKTVPTSEATRPLQGQTQPAQSKALLPAKLEIDLIRIVDARVDILSHNSDKEKAVQIALADITGEVKRHKDEKGFAFEFSGQIIGSQNDSSQFSSHGFFKLAERDFPIAHANIEIAANDVRIEPWARMASYSPVVLAPLTVERLTAKVFFKSDSPCSVIIDASIKGKSNHTAILRAQAQIEPSTSFDTIHKMNIKTRIERLPLQLFEEAFGGEPPVKFLSGALEGEVQGFWQGQGWSTIGSIKVDEFAPGLAFLNAAHPFTGSLEWEGDVHKIELKNAHVARGDTSFNLSGEINEPFSGDAKVNLDCRGTVGAQLLAELLGAWVNVKGKMAVSARITGTINDLGLDSNVNFTSLNLARQPFFQKSTGAASITNFNGRIFKTAENQGDGRKLEGQFKGTIAGVKIGKDIGSPSYVTAQSDFQGKVSVKKKTVHLSDVLITLARSDSSQKICSIGGTVTNLGSAGESFYFQSKATIDRQILNALSILPSNLSISGNSNMVLKCTGTRKRVNWNITAPLNGLELKYEDTFFKPSGVPGNITGTGSLADGRLTLTNGELSLPGVFVGAVGELLDRQGNFQYLDLEIKKGDLAQIGKLFPKSGFTMTGSLAGQIKTQPAANAISAVGAIHMNNVGISLSKQNGVGCSGIKGVVEIRGNQLYTEGLTGTLTGIITAPLKVSGRIDAIDSPDNLNGDVLLETGKGKIRTDFLAAATALGDFVGPKAAITQQLLQLDGGSASVKIRSGQAETQNLRVKGPAIALGAIGSYTFKDSAINALLSMQTRVFEDLPIGNIPAVKDFLKQHEGFLKALGVDKELGKYGIKLPQSEQRETKPSEQKMTPVTLIFTLRGSIHTPKVVPVLESSLDKNTLARIKKLSEL